MTAGADGQHAQIDPAILDRLRARLTNYMAKKGLRSTAQRRFVMLLLSGFALAALLLAGVGIYGTVSQTVAQRTQEIGLRMALGSSPGGADCGRPVREDRARSI